ncbi:MAG: stage sporulation protein [Clostridiales bacterium]|nr:stage sporulation protein [Clostridiales bacterium]
MFKKRNFVIIAVVLLVLTSCARPGPEPLTQPKQPDKPAIPTKISTGNNAEPILRVYDKDKGIVDEMKFEDYIAAVVAGEMKNDWPLQALAAQAIIARSFVLNFIVEKGGSRYGNADVSTDIEEAQAWNPSAVNDRIKEAVRSTRGQVIVYDGHFANTWFHAHSGGMTATAKEGLNYKEKEPPYIQVVRSQESDKAPANSKAWEATFSENEVLRALHSLNVNINDFDTAKVVARGPSGRATAIKFDNAVVSVPELRLVLGSTKMRSTLLTSLVYKNGELIIKGKGYGHGVGMSQWGAYKMAEDGQTASEIIKYYYKGIDIVKMWD